jgi:hypothetical protein
MVSHNIDYTSWTVKRLRKKLVSDKIISNKSPYIKKQELVELAQSTKPKNKLSSRTTDSAPSRTQLKDLDVLLSNEPESKTVWKEFYKMIRWFSFLSHHDAVKKTDACMISTNYDSMPVLTYIIVNLDLNNNRVFVPPTFASGLGACNGNLVLIDLAIFESERSLNERKKRKKFTGSLIPTDDANGHANAMIIDMKKKTIERFEPNGEMYLDVDDLLKESLTKELLPGYRYISPRLYMPKKGPQYVQSKTSKSSSGYCIAFTFLYLHMRVTMPQLSRKEIIEKMMEGGGTKIESRLNKFVHYVDRFVPSKTEPEKLKRFDAKYLPFSKQ